MERGGLAQDSKINSPMSALGQKQTSAHVRVMSALPPKADIRERDYQFAKCLTVNDGDHGQR